MEDFVTFYQSAKPGIIRVLSLSKDAIHIHVGFFTFLISAYFSRRPLRDWKLLIPVVSISLLMEIIDFMSDIYDGRGFLGSWYLHDLLNTNLIPCLIVFYFHRIKSKDNNGEVLQ